MWCEQPYTGPKLDFGYLTVSIKIVRSIIGEAGCTHSAMPHTNWLSSLAEMKKIMHCHCIVETEAKSALLLVVKTMQVTLICDD